MEAMPGWRRDAGVSADGGALGLRAILLVGFMGAGKSRVGSVLSRKLGWRFEDLDARIEAREGCSIPEIFRQSGEKVFRQVDHQALRELLAEVEPGMPFIAALGGGAFVQPGNRALLEAPGITTVYLDAPIEELWQRCCQDGVERPLRGDEAAFRRLHEERRPHYLAAELRVETGGKDAEAIAQEVLQELGFADKQGDVQ